MKNMSFLLIVLMTFFSCKKKVIESNILIPHEAIDYVDCNCPSYDLPYNTPLEPIYGETNYHSPQINPNNPDEIAFTSAPYGYGNQSQIIIYNLATQEKRILLNNVWFPSQLSWGKKDWILFLSNQQLYKIKSNGDSLTPLGYHDTLFHAMWNSIGDRFIAFHKWKLPTEPRTFIFDVNGNVIDSIFSSQWYHITGTWSHPEYYLNSYYSDIRLIDLNTKKIIKHIKSPSLNEHTQLGLYTVVNWVSPTKLIFNAGSGLYTYDLANDQIKHYRCDCNFKIMEFCHAADFSRIVITKSSYHPTGNNINFYTESKLYELNPFTMEEEEIIIPN